MKKIGMPNFSGSCSCGSEEVEYRSRVVECDSPIGNVKTANYDMYCKKCGEKIKCPELNRFNQLLMVLAVMGFWRKEHPEGTRKQCRRALGLTEKTVLYNWDICLAEVMPEDAREEA